MRARIFTVLFALAAVLALSIPLATENAEARQPWNPDIRCDNGVCTMSVADKDKLKQWVAEIFRAWEANNDLDKLKDEHINALRQELTRAGANCSLRRT